MNRVDFVNRYGPWALVTGASSGIGAESARQVSRRGLNVVLVARRRSRLEDLAEEIEQSSGVEAIPVVVDLTQPDFLSVIRSTTDRLEVGLLINNAATSPWGGGNPFLDNPIQDELSVLDVNVRAPLLLTHHFAGLMRERQTGGVVFVSTAAAPQGVPEMANYFATKAYDLVFGEALWREFKTHDLDVLVLCPGSTRTESAIEHMKPREVERAMHVSSVVSAALDSLGNRPIVIPGLQYRVFFFVLSRLLPRRASVALVGNMTRRD